MKSKLARTTTVRRGRQAEAAAPPVEIFDEDRWKLGDRFSDLASALHERGHLDAEAVVNALAAAVVYGHEIDVVDRLLRATKPPKKSLAAETFDLIVRYVEKSRRKPKVWKTDKAPTGPDDESIVIAVAHFWTGRLGVPLHAPSPNPSEWVQVLRADAAAMRTLVKAGTRNAEKLAWAVHRALGYGDTDALMNAARQRRLKTARKRQALPSAR